MDVENPPTRLSLPKKLNTVLVIVTLSMAWAYGCATAVKGKARFKTKTHGYLAEPLPKGRNAKIGLEGVALK